MLIIRPLLWNPHPETRMTDMRHYVMRNNVNRNPRATGSQGCRGSWNSLLYAGVVRCIVCKYG